MIWYFPSHAGDFRLTAHHDKSEWSSLEIVEPTVGEIELLGNFLKMAHDKKWTDELISPEPTKRKKTVRLRAPIAATGELMIDVFKPGDQTLTAVTYADGSLSVVESADKHALNKAIAPKKKPKKVASVKRPTPCCPQCIPGSVERASEVLLSFLSPKQHEQWAEHRAIEVQGHLTGHTYVIAHRHSPLAQHMGYICGDLNDGGVLHFHDWTVPPEEEVLAAKLVMEHREPWLRNEATCLPGGRIPGVLPHRTGAWRDRFKNPFGGITDGIPSATFTHQIGNALFGLLGRDSFGKPA